MRRPEFKKNVDMNRRLDLEIIASLVKPGDRVLDLGCGHGLFLRELKLEHQAEVLGVDIDQDSVAKAIANGVPVIQEDLNGKLDFTDDQSFDLVVLSRTLQETRYPDRLVKRMVSIGKTAAISVINFGHWTSRLQVMFKGRMPRNSQMPYHWYDTPNIHFSTLTDFRELCAELNIEVLQEIPLPARFPRLTKLFPNLFAAGAVFVLKKR